jgi:alkylresorcinol/alkylpyrone synthase
MCTELCGLTFRRSDDTKANIIGTTIFGDGAAAIVLRAPTSTEGPASMATIEAWGEHTWPDTRDIMGWRIEDDGLGVVFSRSIPMLVKERMKAASDAFLAAHGISPEQIEGYVVHPGGEKVISALEEVYSLGAGGLPVARAILAERGNMSAVTVLAVLERTLQMGARGRHLMSALGPGFSAGFAVLTMT